MKKYLPLLSIAVLSACSSQPEADEPSFADPAAHSSEDEQASLADAPESDPDPDLAQQIGGDCGGRDYSLITAQDDTNCAFAMEIYKRAMKATYQLEAPDPSVTPAWQSDITAKDPVSGDKHVLHCIICTNHKNLSCLADDSAIGARLEITVQPGFADRVHTKD